MAPAPGSAPGAWLHQRIEVVTDGLAHGGAAVGRVEGRVVFVRGALPGETVLAEVVDDRKAAFCHARAVEVVQANPHRVSPQCPAAAAGAGCCDLSFADLDYTRKCKSRILGDTLTRVGRLSVDSPAVDALDNGTRPWRVRARLGVDGQGRPGMHAARGHDVITERCIALDDAVYDQLFAHRYLPGSEVIVVHDDDGQIHVTELESAAEAGGTGRAAAQRRRARRASAPATHVIAGSDQAVHRVGDRSWQLPVTGFWQAHREAPGVYSRTVAAMIAERLDDRAAVVWDLYGGAGVFTAGLLDAGVPVASAHVVDTDAAALAAARVTLADAPVHTHRGGVGAIAGTLPAPAAVILDPPRSGAGAPVVDAVAAARPDVIVHVGCDAAAFARDLGLFAGVGYRVVQLRAFDAFPRTHHVEAVAALVRADSVD